MWKKVIAPIVLVILMWATVSLVTTFYIHWLYKVHSQVLTEEVATIRDAGSMQATLWKMQAILPRAETNTPVKTQEDIQNFIETFRDHLAQAEKSADSPQEKVLIKKIKENFSAYCDNIPKVISINWKDDTAQKWIAVENALNLAQAVTDPCQDLLEFNEHSLIESTMLSTQWGNFVNLIRYSFLISGPIMGVIFGLWVARGLHRSISQISITLKDATGELDREVGRVDVYTHDDLPELQEQVQVVAARVRQIVVELQQTRRKAMLAERLAAVGELAAEMAHELRNPLTAVKLLIQTTSLRQSDPAFTAKQLQIVLQEITRMENTIQGLLDFSRPPKLHRVRHDLRETVRRALNLIVDQAKHQKVILSEDFAPKPVLVDGDPEQLHQVFVNLSINGIESMPKGGTLHIAINNSEKSNGLCRVEFRDSGNGISQEVFARIFEPFTTTKENGTGLGLAICQRIIDEHNGSLQAENLDSGGAIFTVELPLSKSVVDCIPLCDEVVTSKDEQPTSINISSHRPESFNA